LFRPFLYDLTHAFRSFRTEPALTFIAVLSLAIGLGATSGAASLLDAFGFRPPAVTDPRALVQIQTSQRQERFGPVSYADYEDMRARTQVLRSLSAYAVKGGGLSGPEAPPEIVLMNVVSPDYFATLGVSPARGRTFLTTDTAPGAPPAVVISDRLWQRRFSRADDITHRFVVLNGASCAVIGVVPSAFTGLTVHLSPDVWIPYATWASVMSGGRPPAPRRDERSFTLVGRLKSAPSWRDSTLETFGVVPTGVRHAQNEFDVIVTALRHAYPQTNPNQRAQVITETAARRGGLTNVAILLWIVVSLVLLVGCANVAGLLLGRAEKRRREMAIRAALGASRGRLIGQLLTEGLALAGVAGAAGLLLGLWIVRSLPGFLPTVALPLGFSFRLDLHVVLITLGVAAVTVLVFALWPALSSARAGIAQAARTETSDARVRAWSARNLLVVAQIAVSFVLVVSGVLFVRGLRSAQRIDPGFEVRPMLLATIAPAAIGYDDAHTRIFFRDLVDRLGATAGVRQVSLARRIPLAADGGGAARKVDSPDHVPPANGAPLTIHYNSVWPNYFGMMGTRLLRGRTFAELDNANAAKVVVVNETMARKYWPDGSALGRTIRVTGPGAGTFEIIGVVQDGKYINLSEKPDPYLFFSLLQVPSAQLTLMVQTDADPGAAAATVRNVLKQLDPRMPTMQMMTLEEHTRFAFYEPHLAAVVVGNLGAAGLVLSLVGLYGVVAFVVARRRREIGVRMALGARPADIFRAVMTRALGLALCGVLIGTVTALLVTQTLAGSIYGVNPSDPLAFISTAALLVIVSAVASWWPARRAMQVDPVRALRAE
jgi:putative ABC transport system permease protein